VSRFGLVLEASRDERRIKVSVYERGGGVEGTLRPYEESVVSWDQVESGVSEITSLLNRANKRGKLSAEIFRSLAKAGQILFDSLIPHKAREKLNSSAAGSLILYIDDKLVHIPWELLFNGREFLCRRFAMGRVVSTSQVPTALAPRQLKAPLKVLILADPRQDLKASYREGLAIRNLLDEQSNDFEVDFKSAPIDVSFVKKNLRDYDVVHYAGHADYDPRNPSEGGWLLTDGRLRASEISTMGGLQPMPFLVFSNACQSGQSGEWHIQNDYGEQIFGLANAYLMAGVRHYIGTFWEILDEPSSHFARQFYDFLARGEDVGEAVRKARERLIEDFGEETIVWASYMLYGDPTFAFAAAKEAASSETFAPSAASVEWNDAMRGSTVALPVSLKPARSARRYTVAAALAIAAAMAGYAGFYSDAFRREASLETSRPAATPPLTVTTAPGVTRSATETPQTTVAQKPESSEETSHEKTRAGSIEPRTSLTLATHQESRKNPSLKESPKKGLKVPAKEVPRPQVPALPAAVPESGSGPQLALKTEPAGPVTPAPLALSMTIIGQRKEPDGSYVEVLVNEGSMLRSYDNFQVHLQTNRPAHVYILIYDSQGRASQLFPDSKIAQPGAVEGGKKLVVPGPDLWFWLDERPGTETIYVLASEKPMQDIKSLLAKMEAADEEAKRTAAQEIQRHIKIMQRGVGGITKGQVVTYRLTDGKKIEKVTEVVTGTGVAVRSVSFHHK
jgi:CHAT domain-containing protein